MVGATWLAVFKRLGEFDPSKAALSTYVGLRAKQACFEARRTATTRQRGDAATLRFSECSVEPESSAEESGYAKVEAVDLILSECSELSPRQREIVEAVVDCGGSQADAAVALGTSRANVARAIATLRRKSRK